ncbi:hypothetical protein IG631_10762 [Alternaria alternata]|nr:hypothetical protein IG631_10762 [Alternaria alternata]
MAQGEQALLSSLLPSQSLLPVVMHKRHILTDEGEALVKVGSFGGGVGTGVLGVKKGESCLSRGSSNISIGD